MNKSFFKKIALVAALGVLSSGSALAAVNGKVGHAMPEEHPQAIAMNKFVELAAKYTNNNVQLKAFHSAVLGSDENLVGLQLEQAAERATLRRSVEQLAPRERQIMELRFGLVDGVEHTQKEAADALGISQSYISRLEKRIIRQLKEVLERE